MQGLPKALGRTRGLFRPSGAVEIRAGVFGSEGRPYSDAVTFRWTVGMAQGGRWRCQLCPITRYSPIPGCNMRTRRRAAMNFFFINTVQVRG